MSPRRTATDSCSAQTLQLDAWQRARTCDCASRAPVRERGRVCVRRGGPLRKLKRPLSALARRSWWTGDSRSPAAVSRRIGGRALAARSLTPPSPDVAAGEERDKCDRADPAGLQIRGPRSLLVLLDCSRDESCRACVRR
eukprot:356701-Chlamydomonas_euryale.AAC.6